MRTTVSIPGIHCAACAALIRDVSGEFPAITDVSVDVDAKRVTLEHEDGFDAAAWKREIEALGGSYTVLPA